MYMLEVSVVFFLISYGLVITYYIYNGNKSNNLLSAKNEIIADLQKRMTSLEGKLINTNTTNASGMNDTITILNLQNLNDQMKLLQDNFTNLQLQSTLSGMNDTMTLLILQNLNDQMKLLQDNFTTMNSTLSVIHTKNLNIETAINFIVDSLAGKINLARYSNTSSSKIHANSPEAESSNVVDGNSNSNYLDGSCYHSAHNLTDPWVAVTILSAYVHNVRIVNRGDCCGDILHDFNVYVSNDTANPTLSLDKQLCVNYPGAASDGEHLDLVCQTPIIGRNVILQIYGEKRELHVCEIEVYGQIFLPSI